MKVSNEKSWQDFFPDPVELLRPEETTVPKGVFLNTLECLHSLVDSGTYEDQRLLIDLVELCRNPNHRPAYPAKVAMLLSIIGGQSEISWRGRVEVGKDIRSAVLALTKDGEAEKILLLAVQEAAKLPAIG